MHDRLTNPAQARSARGNATLLHLDCEHTLIPATRANPHLAFLQGPIDLIRTLPNHEHPAKAPAPPNAIQAAIADALTRATATIPPQDHPAHATHRKVIQTLARCQTRAARLQHLLTPEQTA